MYTPFALDLIVSVPMLATIALLAPLPATADLLIINKKHLYYYTPGQRGIDLDSMTYVPLGLGIPRFDMIHNFLMWFDGIFQAAPSSCRARM
jgi:hypothetical protein